MFYNLRAIAVRVGGIPITSMFLRILFFFEVSLSNEQGKSEDSRLLQEVTCKI